MSDRIPYTVKIALLLFVTTLIIFVKVGGYELTYYDDNLYVTENDMVRGGLSWQGVARAFGTIEGASYWHPLTWLSLMLDVQLFGFRPGALHLVNVLLHALNTVLLFLVLVRMTGRTWRSAFVAALFAFHPLHVESVAWVTERKDVLSAFFGLLTIGAYVRYADRPGLRTYGWVALFLVLGLLSKPSMVIMPCLLLLLDFWPLGRMGGRLRRAPAAGPERQPVPLLRLCAEKLPLLAASAATSVVTALAQKHGDVMAESSLGLLLRMANAVVGYVRYLAKTFWPSSLSVFYPHPGPSLPAWQAVGAFLLLVLITVLVLRRSHRSPWLPMGWFWFLGTLVPMIGLVQVGAQSIADRYTYVSLIGIFIMIAWEVPERLKDRLPPRALPAAALAVIIVLAGLTWRQLGFWKDHETLFRHAIAVTEGNCVAHSNLAVYLMRKGERVGAAEHLRESLRMCPKAEESWYNLGILQRDGGELAEAERSLREAVRLRPGYVEAWSNLGSVYLLAGRADEAIGAVGEAERLSPNDATVRFNLGTIYDKAGRLSEAIGSYQDAVRLRPDYAAAWNNLGIAYKKAGRSSDAVAAFRQAAQLRPDDPAAWYNFGLLSLSTGDTETAIDAFRRTVGLAPGHPAAWYQLGLAYARSGSRQEALDAVQTLRSLDAGRAEELVRRIGPAR